MKAGIKKLDLMFHYFAEKSADVIGHPIAFVLSVFLIVIWLVSGPFFGFSDTWQLIINTTTTIVTFLVVFLIQNTQNREMRDLHIKLNELIRVHKGASNALIDLDNLSDEEMKKLIEKYAKISKEKPKIN